ncbi:MAG: hypothetical protein PHV59_00360 [Victivallales bacterium]|nr:hypothetical protein [Victivallales bacterium]
MTTREKQIQILEEKAARYLQLAADLRAGIDWNKCQYGEYTNELYDTHGCKTCGTPTVVICSHPAIAAKRRNSKGCNPANCKHFEMLSLEYRDTRRTIEQLR